MLMAVVLAAGSTAFATTVTYSTEGSINGGAFSNNPSITFGSGANQFTFDFNGIVGGSVNANPSTFASFGYFETIGTTSGATIPANQTFTLKIFQNLPNSGTGTLAATLSGTVSFNSSSATVSFSQTSTTIGGVNYALQYNPVALVPFSTLAGDTTLQGVITATPEPLTFAFVGAGLIGLGLLRKRAS